MGSYWKQMRKISGSDTTQTPGWEQATTLSCIGLTKLESTSSGENQRGHHPEPGSQPVSASYLLTASINFFFLLNFIKVNLFFMATVKFGSWLSLGMQISNTQPTRSQINAHKKIGKTSNYSKNN